MASLGALSCTVIVVCSILSSARAGVGPVGDAVAARGDACLEEPGNGTPGKGGGGLTRQEA